MSTRAWGHFSLDNQATVVDKVNLGFYATKIASENEFGIILGGNVPLDLRGRSEEVSAAIPFEIVDDPISNVAEETFAGNGVKVYVQHRRVDKGESLDSRMARVQRFLQRVLQVKVVKGIVLHVSEGFGEEAVLETSVDDFKDKILGMYTHGGTWTPTVKLILKK